MHQSRSARIAALLCALALSPAQASLAEPDVFQWTDEQGRVHFGEVPPADAKAQQRVLPPVPGASRAPATFVASDYARSVLSTHAFQRVSLSPRSLTFSLEVPTDWPEIGRPEFQRIRKDMSMRWTSAQMLNAHARGGEELPLLMILHDPKIRAEDVFQASDPVAALRSQVNDTGIGLLRLDEESGAFTTQSRVQSEDSEWLSVWMAFLPTRAGGVVLMASVPERDLPAYRPLLLYIVRSIEMAPELRVERPRDDLLTSAATLRAGPALGISAWLVCTLLLLMLHSAGPSRSLQVPLSAALIAAAFACTTQLARSPEEVSQACHTLGNLLLCTGLLAWAIAVRRGAMQASPLLKSLALGAGAGLIALNVENIGIELLGQTLGTIVLIYLLLFRRPAH